MKNIRMKKLPTFVQKLCDERNIKVQRIKNSDNNYIWWDNEIIIKKYKRKDNYIHELSILNRLQQLNKKYFPKILSSYDDQKIIIMNKLDGYALDDVWHKIDNKENIFVQLTDILKNINSIKPFIDFDFLKHYKNRYRYLYKKAKYNPFLKKWEMKLLNKKIIKTFKSLDTTNIWLIHYDFWVKNILCDWKNIVGVIDFEQGFFWPLYMEWLKILRDNIMINMEWCDDTSLNEISFMDGFINYLKINYPDIFVYNKDQYYNHSAIEYIYKLSKFKQSWYDHKEVEYIRKSLLWY